jgi:hypothetical protein
MDYSDDLRVRVIQVVERWCVGTGCDATPAAGKPVAGAARTRPVEGRAAGTKRCGFWCGARRSAR